MTKKKIKELCEEAKAVEKGEIAPGRVWRVTKRPDGTYERIQEDPEAYRRKRAAEKPGMTIGLGRCLPGTGASATIPAMTELLERAISEAARLPETQQDALASLVLEEIASEARWNESFAKSQDTLARLADDALAEFHAGRTLPLDPERDLADH